MFWKRKDQMAWRSDVGDYLTSCHQEIRRDHHKIWMKARKAKSVESAHRTLKRNLPHHRLPEPWIGREHAKHRVLRTTGQYTKGRSDPITFDHRETEPTGAVESFTQ